MTAGTKFIRGGVAGLGIAGPLMADAMTQPAAQPAPFPRTVVPSTAPAQPSPY